MKDLSSADPAQAIGLMLAAMPAASSVPAAVEALLLPMKLAVLPAYAFPAVQSAAEELKRPLQACCAALLLA